MLPAERPLPGGSGHSSWSDDWRDVDWPKHTSTVRTRSGQVSYADIGDGPTLLLVHGLGGSWEVWIEMIVGLAGSYRVLAVDLPGFGASPVHDGVGTVASYARVLEDFCRVLDVEPVVAVGNSLGGWIAVEMVMRAPSLVDAVVLISAVGIPPTWRERAKLVVPLRVAGLLAPLMCRYRRQIMSRPRLRAKLLAGMFAHPESIPEDVIEKIIPERPSPSFQRVMTLGIRSWSPAWCDRVSELDTPALVLWGDSDAQLPIRHAQVWGRLLRHAAVEVVAGAGHIAMLDQPRLLNARIDEFLTGRARADIRTA